MRRVAILTSVFVCVLFCASRQVSSSDSPAAATDELDQLRERYLALVKDDIKPLSMEELESKIREVEIALAEKQAVKLLKQAEDVLRKLTNDFPDTPSARIAKGMLSHARTSRAFGRFSELSGKERTTNRRSGR